MDIRMQKTQEAIFEAFYDLLSTESFKQISVGQIIEKARIGRSTFYSHFASKDDLLSAVCANLFEHVFEKSTYQEHVMQNASTTKESLLDLLTHLLQHFKDNKDKISTLFKLEDEYFERSFQAQMDKYLVPVVQEHYFKASKLPQSLIQRQITGTFLTCLNWWLREKSDISARAVSFYYLQFLA